jgi:hypothetical protein
MPSNNKSSNNNQTPKFQIFDPTETIGKKLDFYIQIVIVVLVVGFLSMLAMIGTLIIDSFHFNSATYTEYSNKITTLNDLQQINKKMLDENKILINKIYQDQATIQELLNKASGK